MVKCSEHVTTIAVRVLPTKPTHTEIVYASATIRVPVLTSFHASSFVYDHGDLTHYVKLHFEHTGGKVLQNFEFMLVRPGTELDEDSAFHVQDVLTIGNDSFFLYRTRGTL